MVSVLLYRITLQYILKYIIRRPCCYAEILEASDSGGKPTSITIGPGSLLGQTDEALLGQWVIRVNESDPVATLIQFQ